MAVKNRVCGEELPEAESCGVHMERHISSKCKGRQECVLDWTEFENLCPRDSEFAVRWTCKADGDSQADSVRLAASPPLRAEGSILVDTTGSRVRFTGVNWPAHITHVPSGLDRQPLSDIARLIRRLGFNVVRLTWSVESVLSNPVVEKRLVAANPELVGLRHLDVMDEVIASLEKAGVMIWLDNHMLQADWCCQKSDCNGFWFNERYSEADWVLAWRQLVKRTRQIRAVVGVGLKNEVRSVCGGKSWGVGAFCNASFYDHSAAAEGCANMQWSSGPPELQWRRAAERAGRAVLEENPDLLVAVGGLDYAKDLLDFASQPVDLPKQNLVFEAHEYSWNIQVRLPGFALEGGIPGQDGPLTYKAAELKCFKLGLSCAGFTCDLDNSNCRLHAGGLSDAGPRHGAQVANESVSVVKRFKPAFSDYADATDKWWGRLVRENVAPVLVTEFGMAQNFATDEGVSLWWSHFSHYAQEAGPLGSRGGLDWMYWSLPGEQDGGTSRVAGATETFGVLNHCMTAPASEQHVSAIRSIMRMPTSLHV
eukprot:TRINITY_DN56636_c0_g1_i1.p1 TRINITY_DN56636_c0_g1~~TRINITY_DN56636_c0_g1_i1.p1  ORF type:complete len:614 (-),score=114.23 TRINITY_DN56636_c0_g1_i1:5-1618(-)